VHVLVLGPQEPVAVLARRVEPQRPVLFDRVGRKVRTCEQVRRDPDDRVGVLDEALAVADGYTNA